MSDIVERLLSMARNCAILDAADGNEGTWMTIGQTQKEAADEIERLRYELAEWKRVADEGHPRPCTLGPLCPYCEIERLRERLDWLNDAADGGCVAADEIERLRDELSIWKSVFPDIAPEEVQPDRASLLAEIERLRGLLASADLALAEMPQPTRKLRNLRDEIAKAVGDVPIR